MCSRGRTPGSPSTVPNTTSVTFPEWVATSGDPHLLQKHLSRPGEDLYPATDSPPAVHRNWSGLTNAQVANAAPWDFLHMEQWQWPAPAKEPEISYLTVPHRQLPLIAISIPPVRSGQFGYGSSTRVCSPLLASETFVPSREATRRTPGWVLSFRSWFLLHAMKLAPGVLSGPAWRGTRPAQRKRPSERSPLPPPASISWT